MAHTTDPRISREDAQALADVFADAIEPGSVDTTTKALFGGVNVRLNVGKTLKAAFYGAKIWFKAHAAPATGGLSLLDGLSLADDALALVKSALDAVRERVPADAYVALIVLGSEEKGMRKDAFQSALTAFVNDAEKAVAQPWYVGLTAGRIADTKAALSKRDGFADLIAYLQKGKWLDVDGDVIKLKPRHFEWGLTLA